MAVWEANPLAVALGTQFGIWAPVTLRIASVVFAAAVATQTPHRCTLLLTGVAFAVHAYLLAIYAIIFAENLW